MKHGFIGFGNMAQAIYRGLKEYPGNDFAYISKRNSYKDISSFDTLSNLVNFSNIIWLCVKPQVLDEILHQLKGLNLKDKVIVSIVAGNSISFMEKYLEDDVTIIRTMPNLAIEYNRSVTAFCSNKKWTTVNIIKDDLEKLWKVLELEEEKFDLFTAIFGSGPAFLLEILQVFKNQIDNLGVSDQKSEELLGELLTGTWEYFKNKKEDQTIEDLIKNVTSKWWVTQAGLEYFWKNNGSNLLGKVIDVASKRSKNLGS